MNRKFFSVGLLVVCALSAPVLLASCGEDGDPDIRKPAVTISATSLYDFPDFGPIVLPAAFDVTGRSIEDDMTPEHVRSIGILKPEYQEAMDTDALNFIDVRRRT